MGRPPDPERKIRRSKSKASPVYQQKVDPELRKLQLEFGPRRVTRSMSKNRPSYAAPNYVEDTLEEPPMNQRKPSRVSAQRQYQPAQAPIQGNNPAYYAQQQGQYYGQSDQPQAQTEEQPFLVFFVPSYEAYRKRSLQFEKTLEQLDDAMDNIQHEYKKFGMMP